MRMGRWALLTERLETESVFVAGMEGAYLRPGDVIKIYDQYRNGIRYGGRAHNIACYPASTEIVLDDNVYLENNFDYKLSILTPSYSYDPSIAQDINQPDYTGIRRSFLQNLIFNNSSASLVDGRTKLIINQGLNVSDYNVSGNNIWAIEPLNSNLYSNISGQIDYYRIINIQETDPHKYNIEALSTT